MLQVPLFIGNTDIHLEVDPQIPGSSGLFTITERAYSDTEDLDDDEIDPEWEVS